MSFIKKSIENFKKKKDEIHAKEMIVAYGPLLSKIHGKIMSFKYNENFVTNLIYFINYINEVNYNNPLKEVHQFCYEKKINNKMTNALIEIDKVFLEIYNLEIIKGDIINNRVSHENLFLKKQTANYWISIRQTNKKEWEEINLLAQGYIYKYVNLLDKHINILQSL